MVATLVIQCYDVAMKREDIMALADLARIELTEKEIEQFSKEFDDILTYVARVKGLAEGVPEKKLGVVHNVFREDENPHEAGKYSEALLNELPSRKGMYAEVKKILG